MKARKRGSKEPFEEVEYVQLKDSYVITKADQMEFENENSVSTSTDWEQVRINAAIAAMQGMIANSNNELRESYISPITESAVVIADELVKKLKEE